MALTDKLTAIANAIRSKTGKDDKLTLEQMPLEIAKITGGGGSGTDANIVPLIVGENGAFDENGPVIVTETFTGGTPDLVLDYYGTPLPFFKAKKLVATDAILGAIETGQVSFTADSETFPITYNDVKSFTTENYVVYAITYTPVMIWVITPADPFLAEAGFEPNSVYILDVWSAGMLGEGMTASLTALGIPDTPIDGYMPVEVAIPFEDLEVTPRRDAQTFDGYYKHIAVKSVPTEALTITPSVKEQVFMCEYDINGNYLSYDKYRWFNYVKVEAVDLTKMQLLCDIELETLPNKLEYQLGEWLDTTGGVLLQHYTDGTTSRITLVNSYIYGWEETLNEEEGTGARKPGKYTLKVKYTENGITCRTTYDITVAGDSGGVGTRQITENGTYDVSSYASVEVNVQPNLQQKTATANGVVSPDNGYDGLSYVDVAIPEFDGTVVIS